MDRVLPETIESARALNRSAEDLCTSVLRDLHNWGSGTSVRGLKDAVESLRRTLEKQEKRILRVESRAKVPSEGAWKTLLKMPDMYRGVADVADVVEKIGDLAKEHAYPPVKTARKKATDILAGHAGIIQEASNGRSGEISGASR